MLICHCDLHFELSDVHSLKGRRRAFNVSVMDVSGEYPKEADIAFVFLTPDARGAAQYREGIERMLEQHFSEYRYDLTYEEI